MNESTVPGKNFKNVKGIDARGKQKLKIEMSEVNKSRGKNRSRGKRKSDGTTFRCNECQR